MKKFLISLMLFVCPVLVYAQECPEHLFYIDKSDNANVLYYDAVVSDGKFNTKNPVEIYWILHAKKGQRDGLSMLERPQFGIKVTPVEAEKEYIINVRNKTIANRAINVHFNENGCAVATAEIGGKSAYLERIFIQISPDSGIIPDVLHLDIFGRALDSGEEVTERVMNK